MVGGFHQEYVITEKIAWEEKRQNLPAAVRHYSIPASQAPSNYKTVSGGVALLHKVHACLEAFLLRAECLKQINVIIGEGCEARQLCDQRISAMPIKRLHLLAFQIEIPGWNGLALSLDQGLLGFYCIPNPRKADTGLTVGRKARIGGPTGRPRTLA
jgi:hypothetical protein